MIWSKTTHSDEPLEKGNILNEKLFLHNQIISNFRVYSTYNQTL